MSSLEELFCKSDDFCQSYESQWQQQLLGHGLQIRNRPRQLCLSEIMTILVGVDQQQRAQFQALLH